MMVDNVLDRSRTTVNFEVNIDGESSILVFENSVNNETQVLTLSEKRGERIHT